MTHDCDTIMCTAKIWIAIPHVNGEVNESGRSATFTSGLAIFNDLPVDTCSNQGNKIIGWLLNTAHSVPILPASFIRFSSGVWEHGFF